jgi:hypothetical protein
MDHHIFYLKSVEDMKSFLVIAIILLSMLTYTSCNDIDDKMDDIEVLNFEMNCNQDSSLYYYTLDYDRVYLDISNHCVTIKFSGKVSTEYLNNLSKRNSELDSISFINEEKNIAYGYLKKDICCEEIIDLLISLTLENQIQCANPSFYLIETILRGTPINDRYDLIGLTDEFIVKLKDDIPDSILESLISQTNTKLIQKKEYYSIISADKYSDRNCLEMSRYFYETGYFEYSHPNLIMNTVLFR